MPETDVQKFRRRAAACRDKADEASWHCDKQAWLKLVDDWGRLAQGEDLRMEARRKLPANFRHWDEAAL